MAQTPKKSHVFFPDGAMVEVDKGGGWVDVGAIGSNVEASLEWEENRYESANAGPMAVKVRQMTMSGSFTLINLDPEGIEILGGGVFTKEYNNGTEIAGAAIDNQTISAGWDDAKLYELKFRASANSDTPLRFTEAPKINSVVRDPDGDNETLTAWTDEASGDYYIVTDKNSESGYSIIFNSAGMEGIEGAGEIVINFDDNTPIESTTIYAGSSTQSLTAYSMRVTHTDSDDKIRRLELYSVDGESGGFQFGFKGATEDGVEEMPLSFRAKLDTNKTDKKQLMAWTIEAGAA